MYEDILCVPISFYRIIHPRKIHPRIIPPADNSPLRIFTPWNIHSLKQVLKMSKTNKAEFYMLLLS